MERPSHSNFKTYHPFYCRLALLGLAISFQLAVLWGLTHGFSKPIGDTFHRIVYIPDKDDPKPKTPPPTPDMQKVTPLRAEAPRFRFDPAERDNNSVTPTQESPMQNLPQTQAAGPDTAAVAIARTHTVPPYPMLARRVNAEGKVTLRLTVLADGTVGKAEIVTSSGRHDLDAAAEDWIMAHWTYRPALDKGQPVISQTLASVVFSLQAER